jgi:hypothetical protein
MIEKDNPLAVHVIFESKETGEAFLKNTVPDYVARSLYMDKTLTAESFEIVPRPLKTKR